MTNNVEERRTRSGMELIMRSLATGAVWAVVALVGLRLRHPVIRLTLIAVGASVTLLIWTHNSKAR